MKKWTFILLILGLSIPSFSQVDSLGKKNIVKLNFLSLAVFKTTTLNYERSMGEKTSLGIGIGRKFTGSLPSLFSSEESDLQLLDTDLKGFFVNLEMRWYLDKCNDNQFMKGFFVGPYLKYNNYNMDFMSEFDTGSGINMNEGEAKLSEIGIGGMIGYHLHLGSGFTIDFVFLGPRLSRFDLNLGFKNEISQEFIDSVNDNVNAVLERVLMDGGINLEIEDGEVNSGFTRTAFKYGIGIGYKF
jgi:hypothetical protein